MFLKRLMSKHKLLYQNIRLINTFKGITEGKEELKQSLPVQDEKFRNLPLSVKYLSEQDIKYFPKMESKLNDHSTESLADIKADIEFLKEQKKAIKVQLKRQKKALKVMEDPSYAPTNIPCGGCGAILQCNDIRMTGFISKRDLIGCTETDLLKKVCRRCNMLGAGIVMETSINKTVYKDVVKRIQSDDALIVMVVDLTDIGNSIIPDYLNMVGKRRPIYIVGNKIDLFPWDQKGYLNHIGNRLLDECDRANLNPRENNIRHACLVSAKTGYGIEKLINKLIKFWDKEGHVYLVGSANSGKSTLFNRLISSDYCKHSCRDMVKLSTTSRWPGTTLDVLGFPISNLNSHQLMLRSKRLIESQKADRLSREKRNMLLEKDGRSHFGNLFGSVYKTDFRSEEQEREESKMYMPTGQQFSDFTEGPGGELIQTEGKTKSSFLHPRQLVKKEMYPDSQWTFDTPGLINKNQIITWMTMEELFLFIHKVFMIRPRVFVLEPGDVMFITGLVRIDYLEGAMNTLFTVCIPHNLPIHVVKAEEADQFYLDNVGTSNFEIPIGGQDRLDRLPSLVGREFTIQTKDHFIATADLQLSSLGWISFSGNDILVHIRAYMPGGRGMHVRSPAMLPNVGAFMGSIKRKGSKEYKIKRLKIFR